MLSPDAFVQNPGGTQAFNRYSYVMNNPLKYSDPSGWLFSYSGGGVSNWNEFSYNNAKAYADMSGQIFGALGQEGGQGWGGEATWWGNEAGGMLDKAGAPTADTYEYWVKSGLKAAGAPVSTAEEWRKANISYREIILPNNILASIRSMILGDYSNAIETRNRKNYLASLINMPIDKNTNLPDEWGVYLTIGLQGEIKVGPLVELCLGLFNTPIVGYDKDGFVFPKSEDGWTKMFQDIGVKFAESVKVHTENNWLTQEGPEGQNNANLHHINVYGSIMLPPVDGVNMLYQIQYGTRDGEPMVRYGMDQSIALIVGIRFYWWNYLKP